MQCDEFEARWQALLDERRLPDEESELRAHAEVCTLCRRLLTGHDALFGGLSSFPLPALPRNFAAQVVAEFRAQEQEPVLAERAAPSGPGEVGWPAAWGWAFAALAGAVAVGVYLGTAAVPADPLAQPQTPATPSPPAVAAAPQNPAPPNVAPSSGGPLLSPAEGLAASARGEEALQLQEFLEQVRAQLPPEAEQQSSEYAAEVVDRFRPVASPVSSLFNVLLRTLPGGKENGPRKPQAFAPWPRESMLG